MSHNILNHLQMIKLTLVGLLISAGSLAACNDDEIVSSVLIDIIPLEQTVGGEPHELNGSGTLTVTPYDMNANTLYNSVSFDIAARTGEIPPLPLGTWRFYVNGIHNGQSIFGVSTPFEVNGFQQVLAPTIVGKSQCTGLLPPLRGPEGIVGSSDLARAYDGSDAIALDDGRVLILGGGSVDISSGQINTVSSDIQYFDPKYGVVRIAPTQLGTPRAFHHATRLNDGRILVAGGVSGITADGQYIVDNTAEIITVNADGSLSISPPIPMDKPRYQHMQTLLNDGSVLLAGGLDATTGILSSATRFFPETGIFIAQGNLNSPRVEASMSPLIRNSEKALITGGLTESGVLSSTELFTTDPAAGCVPTPTASTGCFSMSTSLNRPRWGHNSAMLEDGSILILGGFEGGSQTTPRDELSTIEQYKFQIAYDASGNPVSATVLVQDAVGRLASSRGHGTLVRINPQANIDHFAFVGGEVSSSKAAVSLINAQALSQGIDGGQIDLRPICPLSEDRYRPMAVTTPEGSVMIFGGVKRGNDPSSGTTVHIASRRIEVIYPAINNISQSIPQLIEN
jgi:hypothetical protein